MLRVTLTKLSTFSGRKVERRKAELGAGSGEQRSGGNEGSRRFAQAQTPPRLKCPQRGQTKSQRDLVHHPHLRNQSRHPDQAVETLAADRGGLGTIINEVGGTVADGHRWVSDGVPRRSEAVLPLDLIMGTRRTIPLEFRSAGGDFGAGEFDTGGTPAPEGIAVVEIHFQRKGDRKGIGVCGIG